MRSYPRNSPEAAARIVALTLLADGHLSRSELDLLEQRKAAQALGLAHDGLHQVLHTLCDDLLAGADQNWADACKVDPDTLSQLLNEVDDAALQLKVMRLCVDVVNADQHVAEGESVVLSAVLDHWGAGALNVRQAQPALAD
jgi:uncharacterized tellurite resistance protein B-like protein